MRCSPLLVAALVAFCPRIAAGHEQEKNAGSNPSPVQAELSAPEDEDASWEVEIFLRGALAGLRSRGELEAGFRGVVDGIPTDATQSVQATAGYDGETSWGGGVRAVRGGWGLEAQHHRIAAGMFTPAGVLSATELAGAAQLPVPTRSVDLVSTLVLREFPLGGRQRRLFLGFGAGYLLMGNDEALRSFQNPAASRTGANMGADLAGISGGSFEMTTGDFQVDRGTVVFGAALGVTLDLGRFLVRPRFDVFQGLGRNAVEDVRMTMVLPELLQFDGTMTFNTTARPRLLLFTVDVGWSFRP